jgi:hypothetical protein
LDGRACRCAEVTDRPTGALADAFDRVAEVIGESLDELGVVVDGRQHSVEDPRHAVEVDLEQHLGLDALDRELHAAQRGVDADVEVRLLRAAQHVPRTVAGTKGRSTS